MVKDYFKLFRVHHYIKNLLVFAALICSGELRNWEKLMDAVGGFLVFNMVCSVVYIINDVRDMEKDRNHPTKCHRPIASGQVPVSHAWVIASVLFAIATCASLALANQKAMMLLGGYLLLNLGYSFGLKNVPLLDVTILVSGFLLRVLYGAVLTDIVVSQWLYLTVLAVAFYFGLGKRRNELKKLEGKGTRKVLQAYSVNFLDKSMTMFLSLTNVFYALWTMDERTVAHYHTNALGLTVPLVMLITLKYSLNVEGDSDGDPVEVLLHDKMLLFLCVIYAVVMILIRYL